MDEFEQKFQGRSPDEHSILTLECFWRLIVVLALPLATFCIVELMYFSWDLRGVISSLILLFICFPLTLYTVYINFQSQNCSVGLSWKCYLPSIASLIIPLSYVALVFIFFWSSDEQWLRTLLLSILLLLLWFLFSYLLFPRIVVTIMDIDNIKDINQLYLLADGKEIYKYKKADPTSLPIQFSFQVWRRGNYDLCLKIEKNNGEIVPIIEPANTYDHAICHVTFPKKDKQQGKRD